MKSQIPLTFLIITLTFLCSLAHAQPDTLWSKVFGGQEQEGGKSVLQTDDGDFVIAGFTGSYGAGGIDMWLVKTDEEGDTLWSKTFGGEQNEVCYSMIQSQDGGFLLAGMTASFGAGGNDVWLLKTDEEGDSLWSKSFGGEDEDRCYSIIQTDDGGFALVGHTESFGSGDRDFWFVKTNEEGDSLWSKTYGGEDYEICFAIIQTDDGDFVLAGYTTSFGAGSRDVWLLRTDEEGDSIWSRTYGGEGDDRCYSMIETEDGDYALAGITTSFGFGTYDFWLLMTDEEGDSLWSRTYGGEMIEFCRSIIQTEDRGYALAGHTSSFGAGEFDMWLVRTDEDGDLLFSKTFGGERRDMCFATISSADDCFVLTGSVSSFGENDSDLWFIKTEEEGYGFLEGHIFAALDDQPLSNAKIVTSAGASTFWI